MTTSQRFGRFRSTASGRALRTWTRAAILSAALLGAGPYTAQAGVNVWSSLGPSGALVNALVADPATAGTLYAGTLTSGVFKSTDGGATWTIANTGLTNPDVSALAADPSTPGTLYAGTDGGVFKSTDGGRTWGLASTGLTDLRVKTITVDPASPSRLYVGTFTGAFASTDGAATWTAIAPNVVSPPHTFSRIVIDPFTSGTLYAETSFCFFGCGYHGPVFKSIDGGATWNAITPIDGLSGIGSLIVDPIVPGTLYGTTLTGRVVKSTDGGTAWADFSDGLPEAATVAMLAIDPTSPEVLYAAAATRCDTRCVGGGVFRRTDDGVWQPFSEGFPESILVTALALDPATPDTLYAATQGVGVFKGTDGQGSWGTVNAGLVDIGVNVVVVDRSRGMYYAGTRGSGVFRSIDGGRSNPWQAASVGLPPDTYVTQIAIDPHTAGSIYAATDRGLFQSTDDAASWQAVDSGLNITQLAFDPSAPGSLYAVADGGIFTSADNGATWQPANDGLPAEYVIALGVDPLTPGTLYAATFGNFMSHVGVFKSIDGGATWHAASDGLPPTADIDAFVIDPVSPATLFAITSNTSPHVFKSTDGGGTWRAAGDGLPDEYVNALLIDPSSPATVYAATNRGVFKSIDGGEVWGALNAGLTHLFVQGLAIDATMPDALFAATDGGVYDIEQLLPPCVGDCNASGDIQINELITLVGVALGQAEPSTCPNGVPFAGAVDIASLIQAVNNELSGCRLPTPTATPPPSFTMAGTSTPTDTPTAAPTETPAALAERVRDAARAQGLTGSPILPEPDLTAAQREIRELRRELGRDLFFAKALSGVQQTSCATCHHAAFQFGDGRNIARGVFCTLVAGGEFIACGDAPAPGTEGNVVGPDRSSPLNSRNSPLLINAALFPRQMWNGRFHCIGDGFLAVNDCDPTLGFELPSPERVMLTRSILTAQAHIPVTEAVEMTGDFPHLEPLNDTEERNPEIRAGIQARISGIAAYHALFEEAYPADRPEVKLYGGDPQIGAQDAVPYLAIADSIAYFLETLVFTDAPWDHFLAGDDAAIGDAAQRGALTFFTTGQCSACHAGDLFSDFENYNIGVPQVGPGTAHLDGDPLFGGLHTWDFGLEEVTFDRRDRFKFRTPPLRGVALSSPYMHNGAYPRLEDAIRQHTDPAAAYESYDLSQIEPDMQAAEGLKPMAPVFERRNPMVLGHADGQRRIDLTDEEIADLVAFLKTLTDPRMQRTDSLAPTAVPSGLPVDVVGPRRFPTYE